MPRASTHKTQRRSAAFRSAESDAATDKTRALLIQAAKRIFAKDGFHGASIQKIVSEAGVNISMVSYHFGGKEGLYRACLEQAGQPRLAMAQGILLPPQSLDDFRTRLQLYAEELIRFLAEEPDLAKMMYHEAEMQLPFAQEVFQSTFMKGFDTLLGFLKSAQKKHILDEKADPHAIAVLFFGGITHFLRVDSLQKKHYGRTLENSEYRQKIAEQVLRTFQLGVLREVPHDFVPYVDAEVYE